MKVIYCGDFSQPWHTESHVAREMEAAGVEVVRRHGGRMRGLVDACADADLLLLQANGGLQSNSVAWMREIERRGCRTASYHLDLFVGLERERRIDTDVMFATQVVFTADGDPATQEMFAARGIDHRWLPAAVVSDECGPGEWRDEYDYDVVFVGSRGYHVEWPWRSALLDALAGRYGPRFRVFDHHPPTRGNDLNDLYATARVAVGDSLNLPGHRNYTSDRIFETLGRGGALVYPRVPGLEDLLGFSEFEHLRFYEVGDTARLAATIDEMLAEPAMTLAMSKRGQVFVTENHTYRHRVEEMLQSLDLTVVA